MSGDVQPRKRKDKRRKKDAPVAQPEYMAQKVKSPNIEDSPEDVPLSKFSPEETIHIQNEHGTGGNICAKIVFFCLFGVLTVMVGLIVIEYRGLNEVDIPPAESKWAHILDGWLDESPAHHDDHHTEVDEHDEGGHDASGEDHAVSGEEHVGSEEEAASEEEQAASEEEPAGSEEEEAAASEEEPEASKEVIDSGEAEEEDEDDDEQTSKEDLAGSEEEPTASEEDQEEEEADEDQNASEDNASQEQDEESGEDEQDLPGITESQEDNDEDDGASEEAGDADDDAAGDMDAADAEQDGEGEADDTEEEAEEGGAPAREPSPEEEESEEESDDTPAAPTPAVPARQRGGPKEEEDLFETTAPVSEEIPQDTIEDEDSAEEASPTPAKIQFSEELDLAEARLREDPSSALQLFNTVLTAEPNNVRALHGKAVTLDKMAEMSKSNALLEQAIQTYRRLLLLGPILEDTMFLVTAKRCIDRMRFKGDHLKAVEIHNMLIEHYPDEPKYRNELAVTYLMINRIPEARHHLEAILKQWPADGFALVHLGFIIKTTDNNLPVAVDYLTKGIASRAEGTLNGRFFFHLGDALTRLGRSEEATKINQLGVREGVFLSQYQRSLYNVDRLKGQPWWTVQETKYKPYFDKLESSWEVIRNEGLAALRDKKNKLFQDESENLRDTGDWKQLELFARGRKMAKNCAHAPRTCQLISDFPAARDCRRGQVKFSVMEPNTHVHSHCGPTNCRLRAHLGLTVPPGTAIRVATETRTWKEGKFIIFDDSFEHEVWHNGTSTRLVLIVDVWHPELTEEERRTLPAI